MNDVIETLSSTITCLDDFEVRYALIGGLAVSARSEPRFTRDVDLIVEAVTDADAEQLIRAMLGRGFMVHAQLEQKTDGRLATVRLVKRADPEGGIVDLFFASSGVEQEVLEAATLEELTEEIALPIVQAEDLIALKLLAVHNRRRPRDTEDVLNLIDSVPKERLNRTRELLKLIEARRPLSGKGLEEILDELIEASGGQDGEATGPHG